MKKTKWKWVLAAFSGVLLVGGAIAAALLPVTYPVDRSLIVKNPEYRISAEKRNGYTTLVKRDAAG